METRSKPKPRTRLKLRAPKLRPPIELKSRPSKSRPPKGDRRVSSRLHVQMVPLSQLLEWPGNPKEHDLETLGESFERFGYVEPIVYDEGSKRIVAGHGRREKLLAWKQSGKAPPARVVVRNGEWYVPVLRGVSFPNEHEAEAYLLTSNQSVISGGYNASALVEMLARHADDANGIGWDAAEISELISKAKTAVQGVYNDLDAAEAQELTEDEIPELPKNAVTNVGDVWTLGKHRLLCGDCRDADAVGRIVSPGSINVAFTSPPYASQRDYDKSSDFRPILPEDYVRWFEPVQANVRTALVQDGSWFVNIKPSVEKLDTSLYVFDLVCSHVRNWGWHFATEFCWERIGVPKWVEQRFKNQFEPIYQFVLDRWKMRPEAVRHQSDSVPTKGGGNMAILQGTGEALSNDSVPGLAYPGNRLPPFAPSHGLGHPAAFPIGLPAFFLRAYSDPGDRAFDPFAGSGTMFIAAEQLDRICCGVEISPAYCDVIVERWQNLTGKKAQRAQSGKGLRTRKRAG